MDINESLPTSFEWYKNQIAGHHPSVIRNGLRQIGIIKELNSHYILKLIQDGLRGTREVSLYEKATEANKKSTTNDAENYFKELHRFLPVYYGQRSLILGHKGSTIVVCKGLPQKSGPQVSDPKTSIHNENHFLQLEDISMLFENPCIMDIKIGRVSYEPLASPAKKLAEDAKCSYQKEFGFRVNGYRLSSDTLKEPIIRDRMWGRTIAADNLEKGLSEYFIPLKLETTRQIISMFVGEFEKILEWFQRQTIIHFYSSSLLLVYEGGGKNKEGELKVDVRMIDFSHAIPVDEQSGRDENYIFGLIKLIEMFKSIDSKMNTYKSVGAS